MKSDSLVYGLLWLRGDRIIPMLRELARSHACLRYVADDSELLELIAATRSPGAEVRLHCQFLAETSGCLVERIYVVKDIEMSVTPHPDGQGLMQLMINPSAWDSLTLTIEQRSTPWREPPLVLGDPADQPESSTALAQTMVRPGPFGDDVWVCETAQAPTPRPLLAPECVVPSGCLPDPLMEMLRALDTSSRERVSEGRD